MPDMQEILVCPHHLRISKQVRSRYDSTVASEYLFWTVFRSGCGCSIHIWIGHVEGESTLVASLHLPRSQPVQGDSKKCWSQRQFSSQRIHSSWQKDRVQDNAIIRDLWFPWDLKHLIQWIVVAEGDFYERGLQFNSIMVSVYENHQSRMIPKCSGKSPGTFMNAYLNYDVGNF